MAGKKEKELSRHTGRASRSKRVRGYFSHSSDSKRIWPFREGLHVHASVSSASYYLRSWLCRWTWARSAALAGKSLVQEGLGPATPTCPKIVAADSWCVECLHFRSKKLLPRGAPGQVGSRQLVAEAARGQARSMAHCTERPDISSDSEPEHWEKRQGAHVAPWISRLIAGVFALVLTPPTRAHQGPLVSAWKSSHQSQLALSLSARERQQKF